MRSRKKGDFFLCIYQRFTLLVVCGFLFVVVFYLTPESYFSVPFNPKWALPPWASGGVETQRPRGQVSLGHCQVPGASGRVPQERWASSWLGSWLHPALMGQLKASR